jgi:hypothetical protein
VTLLKPKLFVIRALEGVELVGEEADILRDVRKKNREGLHEDAIAIIAKNLAQSPTATVKASEWSLEGGVLVRATSSKEVPVPQTGNSHTREGNS